MDRKLFCCGWLEAEQRVAESKGFVARQQRLIVESERDGQDTAETFQLAGQAAAAQQLREQKRAKSLDEIADITTEVCHRS